MTATGQGDERGLWLERDYEEAGGPRGIPARSVRRDFCGRPAGTIVLPGGSWRIRALTRCLGGQVSRGSWLAFLTRMRLAEDTPQDRAQWGSDPLSLPTAAVTKSHETRAFRDKVPSHGSGAQTSEIQVWQGGHGCGPRGAARGLPPRHVSMSMAVSSPRLLASLSLRRFPFLCKDTSRGASGRPLVTASAKTRPPNKATFWGPGG